MLRQNDTQNVTITNQHNSRCSPQNGCNLTLVEERNDEFGECEELLANHIEGCTTLQTDADILHATVKVEWSLVTQCIILGEVESVDKPFGKVNHTSLTDEYTLRHTR